MTKTIVSLDELRNQIPHLTEKRDEQVTFSWADGSSSAFEIVCKGGTPSQWKNLDERLSEAHRKAAEVLS